MIELQGIKRSWDSFSLDNIDLRVEAGEYFVLLGPCGAGKTLLLETIAGLWYPDQGKIWIKGKDVTWTPPEKRNVGFVYQEYWLFPHLSVEENICYGLKARGFAKNERKEKLAEITEILDLKGFIKHRDPKVLSGGEKQKVALARALAPNPDMLLLDEPFHSLDYSSKERLYETLKYINERLGVTVLHVTHDYAEARTLAHRIGIINEGKVVQIGKPEDIFRHPESPFVAQFLGAKNVLKGKCIGRRGDFHLVKVGEITLKVRLDNEVESVNFCVRPEDVRVSREPLGLGNELQGMLREVSDRGMFAELVLDIRGVDFVSYLHRDELKKLSPVVGTSLYFGFEAEDVCILRSDTI